MTKLITSQHFLDDAIIAEKIANSDFEVSVSPVFLVGGESFQVIIDGNHSFAAAIAAGVEPEISELTVREHDAIALLGTSVEDFLLALWMDGEYIDATTRKLVW